MLKTILLSTAFAVGLTSFAAAQTSPPAPRPAPQMDEAGAPPPPPGDMPPPPPGKGPGPHGERRGPPPPPPPLTKGVDIRLGRDTGLRIECGDEPIAACLDAARSLTDKIPDLTMPPPPPPRGDRPVEPGTGAPDMAPAPPAN